MKKNPDSKKLTALEPTDAHLLQANSTIEGKVSFGSGVIRMACAVFGEIECKPKSLLILTEKAMIEGKIHGDDVVIDGYVKGEIIASSKVTISRTGRVFGKITAPNLTVEPGAFFDGFSHMESFNVLERQTTELADQASPA